MPDPTDSVLGTTKKALGIESDYTAFDIDIIMHINSVFSTLQQLGVGPTTAFHIDDKNKTWTEFFGANPPIDAVKSYMYLRVRLLFDPPPNSFGIDSLDKQAKELEWRMNVQAEGAV